MAVNKTGGENLVAQGLKTKGRLRGRKVRQRRNREMTLQGKMNTADGQWTTSRPSSIHEMVVNGYHFRGGKASKE